MSSHNKKKGHIWFIRQNFHKKTNQDDIFEFISNQNIVICPYGHDIQSIKLYETDKKYSDNQAKTFCEYINTGDIVFILKKGSRMTKIGIVISDVKHKIFSEIKLHYEDNKLVDIKKEDKNSNLIQKDLHTMYRQVKYYDGFVNFDNYPILRKQIFQQSIQCRKKKDIIKCVKKIVESTIKKKNDNINKLNQMEDYFNNVLNTFLNNVKLCGKNDNLLSTQSF